MSVSENIIVGIISGVLTSGLVYILLQAFWKIVVPWYQLVSYRGLDIKGKWFEKHDFAGFMTQESSIVIKQVAHKVTGEISLVKRTNKDQLFETKYFELEGSFYDNFLNITCWNKDRKQLGTHNYLLLVSGAGNVLKGQKCWYDIATMKVVTEEIEWGRIEIFFDGNK